jgi:hypothetical protein
LNRPPPHALQAEQTNQPAHLISTDLHAVTPQRRMHLAHAVHAVVRRVDRRDLPAEDWSATARADGGRDLAA